SIYWETRATMSWRVPKALIVRCYVAGWRAIGYMVGWDWPESSAAIAPRSSLKCCIGRDAMVCQIGRWPRCMTYAAWATSRDGVASMMRADWGRWRLGVKADLPCHTNIRLN